MADGGVPIPSISSERILAVVVKYYGGIMLSFLMTHLLTLPDSPLDAAQKAAVMARRREEEKMIMRGGQRLFETGQYAASVETFEEVLQEVNEKTELGGEARAEQRTQAPPPSDGRS